jgi:hypothetical protein
MPLGVAATRVDFGLAGSIGPKDRERIWHAAEEILGTYQQGAFNSTLALGYVQSGKTTSMAALASSASDRGYRIVIALLGSTHLLLDQNRDRLELMLGIDEHHYTWVSHSAQGAAASKDIAGWLAKGRTLFIPVMKNRAQIDKVSLALSNLLGGLPAAPTLVIDDEADQASLNTRPESEATSSTYAAIGRLRTVLKDGLYVQYTATPYAPLLLPKDDPLLPSAVVFLEPGAGYTGGREFFVHAANSVIRTIPFSDEASTKPIASLPASLEQAFAAYVAGAAILYDGDPSAAPISMLVHATHRTDGQARYHFLLDRYLAKAREATDLSSSVIGKLISFERNRLEANGTPRIADERFWLSVDLVVRELVLWLVNSASDVKKVSWNFSAFHVLIGGNKLDRGFTVEGLTVTYMNRKPSEQIDTLEQRARAFGYRSNLLPYCQVFASPRTIRILQGVVHTEDDLRANLLDWTASGGRVVDWAEHVGLDLPSGTKPTRANVIGKLRYFNSEGGWHSLRRPNVDKASVESNRDIVHALGLLSAPIEDFGRQSFRTLRIPLGDVQSQLLAPWMCSELSPSWRRKEILQILKRHPKQELSVAIMLMTLDAEQGSPRERAWRDDMGFINLFQGRDNEGAPSPRYEGDRDAGLSTLATPDGVAVQVHFVRRKGYKEPAMFTLAIHLGDRQLVRGEGVQSA